MPRLLLLLPSTTYRATAFVEAARRLDVALTVASERPSAFERAQPEGLLTLDFSAPERAAAQVLQFAHEHPIAGVVGVDDDTVVAAAAIAARLGLRGNPAAAALAARDKHLQRELLAQHHVRAPAFALHRIDDDPAALARGVRYPCVLKPLRLSASRGVIRADNPDQFVSAFRRVAAILAEPDVAACGAPARRLLVEEFIEGPEVALEGLLVGGRLEVLALFDKPDPLDGPFFEETIYVTPSRLPRAAQTAIVATAQTASAALGLVEGAVHAELRWNAQGAWLIELAARPIGGRCSAVLRFGKGEGGRGQGTSLEEIVVRHALGMELPGLEREDAAAGVMMIPVPRRGVLREVRGIERARAVPLVVEVAITAHPGQQLVPLPEGARYPGFIFARGETPAEVEAALREAQRRLEFVVD
jgi:formate-dependent phosphoribosylglycinamide formyltransferase (GAR transformylase)